MLIVDNDDFLLVAPRPLLALRHALGRSLISLQGARRIGPQHSWEALYPIQHKNTITRIQLQEYVLLGYYDGVLGNTALPSYS